MEATLSKSSVINLCIFCCKNDNILEQPEAKQNEIVIFDRFLSLLGTYIGTRFLFENVDQTRMQMGACPNCGKDLRRFCDLYCQMEGIQLEIEWGLETLVKKMERAGRIPSRLSSLLATNLETGETNKADIIGNVKAFRGDIIQKCKDKRYKSSAKCLIKPSKVLVKNILEETQQDSSLSLDEERDNLGVTITVVTKDEEVSIGEDNLDDDFFALGDKCDTDSEHSVELKYSPSGSVLSNTVGIDNTTQDDHRAPEPKTANSSSRRTFACTVCSKSYTYKRHLAKHLKNMHLQSESPVLPSSSKTTGNRKIKEDRKESHDNAADPRMPERKHKIICNVCSKSFWRKSDIIRHLRGVHDMSMPEAKIAFTSCKIIKLLPDKTEHKVAKVVPEWSTQKVTCNVCSKQYKSRFTILLHLKEEHSMSTMEAERSFTSCEIEVKPTFDCPVPTCSEVFDLEADLETHKSLHGSFNCLFCDVSKDYAPDLSVHEFEEHPSISPNSPLKSEPRDRDTQTDIKPNYKCSRCPYTSSSRSSYMSHHVESHLGLILNLVSCDICQGRHKNEDTTRLEHFASHHSMAGVDPKKVIKCDQCPAYFLNTYQLVMHKRIVHEKNDTETRTCPMCERVFSLSRNLFCHMKTIHKFDDEGSHLPMPCDREDCKKRFYTRQEIQWHKTLGRHSFNKATKVVTCPECNRECKGQEGLKIHLQSHKRSYVCEQCGLKFGKKSTLDRHYLFHKSPEEWDYQCQQCGRKCQTIYNLRDHMRSHTGERPFECKVCGKKYACRSKMRKHVNKCHAHEGIVDLPRKKNKPKFVSKRSTH